MDLLLNEMIASREKTFSQIINPVINQTQLNNNQNNLRLQIGNTIHDTDEILNIRKVVSFSNEITENEINNEFKDNKGLDLDIESISNGLELTFLDKIKKTSLKESDIKQTDLKIDELYSMLEKLGERLDRANIPK